MGRGKGTSASADEKKLTPVMRQYEEAKAEHPDAILFFRLGDFYEMFKADAVLASEALGLTLTSRNKGAVDEVPMAGVPHHAAHGYVAKLLALGHKVAICEQMGDPSKVRGIVPRRVVRVVTPGLVTETDQLDERENHHLVAIDVEDAGGGVAAGSGRVGFAALDLSTGELTAATLPDLATLWVEIARAEAREILVGAPPDAEESLRTALGGLAGKAALRADPPLPEGEAGVARTIDEAVGFSLFREAKVVHEAPALRAAARALRFARRGTPDACVPVRRVGRHDPDACLRLDETAKAHLELVRAADGGRKGSLLDVVDATVTPAGARLLRRRVLAPLVDVAAIRRRHEEVETFVVHARARAELRQALSRVGDVERLAVRAALGEATPRELGLLRDSLLAAPLAAAAIEKIPDGSARAALLGEAGVSRETREGEPAFDVLPELAQRLEASLVERPPSSAKEGGLVREGFDPELDRLRAIRLDATGLIAELEERLRLETGATSLRVKYTRVFGWYIEVTRAHLSKVPPSWRRKQTVAGGERYTSEALDELAERIEGAEEASLEREGRVFDDLLSRVRAVEARLRRMAARLAEWDVAAALADVAHRFDYVRPEVDGSGRLEIEDGRHPVVERLAGEGRFVPNDTRLDLEGERLWLVTGPNMAGKSTLMRQVALIALLAQSGSFVPARSARIGVVDRILSRVGASDNLSRGESTFMVEMRETASILREATRRSLVILDEIGRGTSTYDGLAIAWAVAEHLHDAIGCRAMFATHYHELTALASSAEGVANYSVSAREHDGDVVFLHKLAEGPASRSYGIAVARLAGIGEGVLARARAILETLEAKRDGREAAPVPLRGSGTSQLGLFDAAPRVSGAEREALATLRALDLDRMTPLEALQLLARLRSLLASSG